MLFTEFNLHRHILEACTKTGFDKATPIQAQAIPAIINRQDVMACAQTGTGKTAAFTLPLIHHLLHDTNNISKSPKVVILSPTRELAEQILVSLRMFTKGTQLKTGVIVGGMAYGPQIKMLSNPLDILVATPGRLIDHFQEGRVNLSSVQTFVLDEADRMLDMGFVKPVETICETMPKDRQTLLFSATFSPAVERLARRFMNNPTIIKLAHATAKHENITQSLFFATGREQKKALLRNLLEDGKVWQTVVFIKTKHQADRMAKEIKDWGHPAAALHGDMRQSARKKVIEQMHQNRLKVLVATDVAARGLDIKDLSHVINFDLPTVAEDYVHRIGRTGRAGAEGVAYSMVSRDEMNLLRAIEKLIGRKIEEDTAGSNASHLPKTQPTKRGATGAAPTPVADFRAEPAKSERKKAKNLPSNKKKRFNGTLGAVDGTSVEGRKMPKRNAHKSKYAKTAGQAPVIEAETSADSFVAKKSFGDKKPYGDKKPWDKKPYGDKKPHDKKFGGGKFAKSSGTGKPGDKKPWDKKPSGKFTGKPSGKPGGKPNGKPGGKPGGFNAGAKPGGKPAFKGNKSFSGKPRSAKPSSRPSA